MTRWVADTSPLIFLSKLDRLDLLHQGADEVLIPPIVLEEIRYGKDESVRKVENALQEWLEVRSLTDTRRLEILLADLDDGEAAAIALALELEADRIVLDDLDGRRLARRLGLETVGTIGLLLAARLSGDVDSLAIEIERLEGSGFRISKGLRESALRAAGELP